MRALRIILVISAIVVGASLVRGVTYALTQALGISTTARLDQGPAR